MNLKILNQEDFIFFTTRNYAINNNLEIAPASKQLQRLYSKKNIEKVTRGIWANTDHPYYNPFGAVPYLLGKEQGYVSFLTALHQHEIISQIPRKIQIATTGHSRTLISPIGYFEFIHLNPSMMTKGIEWTNHKTPYLIAAPEKAILDTLYISIHKGKRFTSLPELDFENIDLKSLKSLIQRSIKNKRIKKAIENLLNLHY